MRWGLHSNPLAARGAAMTEAELRRKLRAFGETGGLFFRMLTRY